MDRGIFVVGLGGTGGLLVPKLAKMIQGAGIPLWLMDGDTVDKSNTERQPYQHFNINEKKATALARKINSNYEINTFEYTEYLTGQEIAVISFDECYEDVLVIGCVDNHSTRILLEEQCLKMKNVTYFDSANGYEDGSVFITKIKDGKKIGTLRSEVFPDIKQAKDHPTGTCGQAIAQGNTQQFVTNDIMANSLAMLTDDWIMDSVKTGVILIDGFERIFSPD